MLLHKGANRFRVRVNVDQYLANAVTPKKLHPDLEHRNATNRHQTFRHGVGKRTQPGAVPGGQQESLHCGDLLQTCLRDMKRSLVDDKETYEEDVASKVQRIPPRASSSMNGSLATTR